MMARFDDEPKHGGHSGGHSTMAAAAGQAPAVPVVEDRRDVPGIPPYPGNWKFDPRVVPGYETQPAGVMALQPEALKAHDASVKEAAEAEKDKK